MSIYVFSAVFLAQSLYSLALEMAPLMPPLISSWAGTAQLHGGGKKQGRRGRDFVFLQVAETPASSLSKVPSAPEGSPTRRQRTATPFLCVYLRVVCFMYLFYC